MQRILCKFNFKKTINSKFTQIICKFCENFVNILKKIIENFCNFENLSQFYAINMQIYAKIFKFTQIICKFVENVIQVICKIYENFKKICWNFFRIF